MSGGAAGPVRRRRVFYIPGYDPFHPLRYRELYRAEGAKQAALSGYRLSVDRRRGGGFGWQIRAEMEGATVRTDLEVLVWADIVRASMTGGYLATVLRLVRTAWIYAASGALPRLMGLRKGPVIAAFYPVVMLLGQGALALALALVAGWTVMAVVGLAVPEPSWPGLVVSTVAAGGTAWAVLRWFRRQDSRLFAYYLLHDYAFSASAGGAHPPVLEGRLSEFVDRIAGALEEDVDEVLVVGHSSGAHLAISAVADLLRRAIPDRPPLGLLTLGQVVPMVSFLPCAHRLRADLALLAASDRIAWVDVSAPGDGCTFALCDPVAVSGVRPAGARWPLVLSAAFSRTLSPERWRALRWRFFRLHFQYLCAFDHPEGYDYFRITAGPQTLAQRFAGRAPSRARIDRAASPHRSVAA
ncbi:lipase family protein [Rubellimicrobium sp. CFH 75288]|uniref:lipase family protein n=1 Tax=Rubellimicrobium sp. CFH 75288 TaxID=2697034 RepID=UPI00141373E7|nr:lipase family protein [Rubellimicrobium sp. CFH 75288]NAZ36077.1 hypothetical protein [Rubellimicrobium sp. CFH 75288]